MIPPDHENCVSLFTAVLHRAHRDVQRCKGLTRRQAITWLTNTKCRSTGSIWWVCMILDIDLEYEQAFVRRLIAEHKKTDADVPETDFGNICEDGVKTEVDMLECVCGDWGGRGLGFLPPDNFSVFGGKGQRRRRCRCSSCKGFIEIGAPCVEFDMFRAPNSDFEEHIRGDKVFLAPRRMCESCGEIYLNLAAAGYCPAIDSDMRLALSEYQAMTGFKEAHG